MRIHADSDGNRRDQTATGSWRWAWLPASSQHAADSHWTEPLPIYVWVIEHPEGAIVVDTGETARVAEPGYFPWWHPYFRFGLREWVRPEEEVGPQLRALLIEPSDVRWLVMTHLHTDHAGDSLISPTSRSCSRVPNTSWLPVGKGRRADICLSIGPPGSLPGSLRLPHPPLGRFRSATS